MPDAVVDCYDRRGAVNERASRLLRTDDDAKHGDLAARMSFRTAEVEDLTHELPAYELRSGHPGGARRRGGGEEGPHRGALPGRRGGARGAERARGQRL
ncbi:hypothetical protein ZWY2020_027090 [Hordeum vulgare]|nr:hypothetical protein ZWY2020_027090 [Hordeum vulgare]